jgi:hypothetical protein
LLHSLASLQLTNSLAAYVFLGCLNDCSSVPHPSWQHEEARFQLAAKNQLVVDLALRAPGGRKGGPPPPRPQRHAWWRRLGAAALLLAGLRAQTARTGSAGPRSKLFSHCLQFNLRVGLEGQLLASGRLATLFPAGTCCDNFGASWLLCMQTRWLIWPRRSGAASAPLSRCPATLWGGRAMQLAPRLARCGRRLQELQAVAAFRAAAARM